MSRSRNITRAATLVAERKVALRYLEIRHREIVAPVAARLRDPDDVLARRIRDSALPDDLRQPGCFDDE